LVVGYQSSGPWMPPMKGNPQPSTVNLGAILFPYLMGTFDYPPPANDVKFVSTVPNYPKATIFQVSSFRTNYFNDLWNLPSPLASMEEIGHLGTSIPLSCDKVEYNILQQALTNLDPTPLQELDLILEPIWDQDSLSAY